MIEHDGFYWLPILPQEMRETWEKLPSNKEAWPEEFAKEYARLRSEFVKARSDFVSWMRKDRDSRMNTTAKTVLAFLIDSLNFDTGRCDPSHKTIADEIGKSERTVERAMAQIQEAGWVVGYRRGKMTSNFYRLRVSKEKINGLLDYALVLREQRVEDRQARNRIARFVGDPTKMSDHFATDPTNLRSHDPTKMADHDPTKMADKPFKGNHGTEPVKEISFSEVREDTYPRESIPTDETLFAPWVRLNIPDPRNHREAFRLLREQRMTPEILRGMAA